MDLGKLPPQAIDLEKSILGTLLTTPASIDVVIDAIKPESFYKDSHSKIYSSILFLHSLDKPTDILTVTNELSSKGQLEEIGGPLYITELTYSNTSPKSILHYALIVQQKYIQREIISGSYSLHNNAFDLSIDIDDLINSIHTFSDGINNLISGKVNLKHVNIISNESFDVLKKAEILNKQGKLSGIPTPIKQLDSITGGWKNGDLIIVAGRPSMGKSSFGLQCALSSAKSNIPVIYYSLEMSSYMLVNKLLFSVSNLDDREEYMALHGNTNEFIWDKLNKAKSIVDNLPIIFDDSNNASVSYIKSTSKVKKRNNECSLIVIDYLQFIERNKRKSVNEELGEICKQLKIIAKQLDIPVILICPLNRESERRGGNKKPQLSDLKDAGDIEYHADIVLFIHRDAACGIKVDELGNSTYGVMDVMLKKHRNGAIDDLKICHNKSLTKLHTYNIDKLTSKFEEEQSVMNFEEEVPF